MNRIACRTFTTSFSRLPFALSSFALLSFAMVSMQIAACANPVPAHRGEPFAPAVHLDTNAEKRGELLFQRYCDSCHPGGEAGLATSIYNKSHPDWVIKARVRWGVGAMPAFSENILSDEALDSVVAYIVAMRESPPSTDATDVDLFKRSDTPPPAPTVRR